MSETTTFQRIQVHYDHTHPADFNLRLCVLVNRNTVKYWNADGTKRAKRPIERIAR